MHVGATKDLRVTTNREKRSVGAMVLCLMQTFDIDRESIVVGPEAKGTASAITPQHGRPRRRIRQPFYKFPIIIEDEALIPARGIASMLATG